MYLELFRLSDNGVRVPVYRSKTFDKMNRVAASEEEDASDDEKSPEEETHSSMHSSSSYRLFNKLSSKKFTGGYSFGSIELSNQALICGNKHAIILVEIYEAVSKGRDLYIGHCEVESLLSHYQ